jgi:hypothetical protein
MLDFGPSAVVFGVLNTTEGVMMDRDLKRARTFLSAKGFQYEPILGNHEIVDPSRDFMAYHEGVACFKGTVLSIGNEQARDGAPVKVVSDPEDNDRHRRQLARQLRKAVQCLDKAADVDLPIVAIIANHEPSIDFEALSLVVGNASSERGLSAIQLFIWFDDFRSDKMLMHRSDSKVCRMMCS